ncbi:unnamed protein product [Cuscuta epithymum]|uniref:RNase H type-1 domain-containing protein n=1 Tax=Cuscuta epithymum TaxID=186058 RepID=A0AAV0F4C6_9ASTE|nr:unnamed protein product [Cuscuta epithymum]CAH9130365.1 unnamed protein product [Cuscuta epithymum]
MNCNIKVVRRVWSYFLSIFGIYQWVGMEYSRFHYWRSINTDKSLMGVVRSNMPGIICWIIWKAYANNVWGSDSVISNADQIITMIKMYLQNWVVSLTSGKLRSIGSVLIEEKLVPRGYKIKGFKLQIIKWQRPRMKWKMNIDACYLSGRAGGGAIVRDGMGRLASAISFPLLAQSPVDAELQAIFFAVKWAAANGFEDMCVETDSLEALRYIEGKSGRRWENELQAISDIRIRKAIGFGHVLREGNWAAHYLAQEWVDQIKIYNGLDQLPILVKKAYWADFYGIPSFRDS